MKFTDSYCTFTLNFCIQNKIFEPPKFDRFVSRRWDESEICTADVYTTYRFFVGWNDCLKRNLEPPMDDWSTLRHQSHKPGVIKEYKFSRRRSGSFFLGQFVKERIPKGDLNYDRKLTLYIATVHPRLQIIPLNLSIIIPNNCKITTTWDITALRGM